ncbi:MAG: hypothetical protein BWK79_09845 [Beggiatoa sp. IS2]|nr:MAG: hypothetical protein BWK79_09845 [Beggiatoa sp. IS2]
MNEQTWQAIVAHIAQTTGQYFEIQTHYNIVGGCINNSYRIEGTGQNYFVKLNDKKHADVFAAEAAGLNELAKSATIKVPLPLCWGATTEHAYLVMEYLALYSSGHPAVSTLLGQQLAAMHRVTGVVFGHHRNNYIGLTPQLNVSKENWIDFWRQHRLGFQLEQAARNGYGGQLQHQGERLLIGMDVLFDNYPPVPSLLHGDLWSGNCAAIYGGQPVVFDPAVYYGDRETDLAMTELFGGFSTHFYNAYQDHFPLKDGYYVRKNLYNLYHILNHLNLFGSGYLKQAEEMVALLLSELH